MEQDRFEQARALLELRLKDFKPRTNLSLPNTKQYESP